MKFFLFVVLLAMSIPAHSQVIQTFAGNGVSGFSGEGGPAISAQFNRPAGVATDRVGNIYIASDINNIIQKIDTNGTLTRFAGSGLRGYSGDGGLATSARLSLNLHCAIAVDSIGNVYFSDSNVVRKVDATGIISTVAGNGTRGYSGDGRAATAAQFFLPAGICFDKTGNLFILDYSAKVLRKVNTVGIISTIAGSGTSYVEGQPASSVALGGGIGVATDDSGNIFITDAFPFNYSRIRKINTSGIISTFGGGGIADSCDGCVATSLKLISPWGLVVDHEGSLYVAAAGNQFIHKITPSGLAYRIAGNGDFGYSGDGGPARLAKLNSPLMIWLDNKGDLLFSDMGNSRFRKITLSTTNTNSLQKTPISLKIFPNPHSGNNFTIKLTSPSNEEGVITISNLLGESFFVDKISTNQIKDISLELASGMYTITVQTATSSITSILISD